MNAAPQVRNGIETELARYARILADILRSLTTPPDQLTDDLLAFAETPSLDSRTHVLFNRAITTINDLTSSTASAARSHPLRAKSRQAFPLRLLSWLLPRRARRGYILPASHITRVERDIQAQLNILSARVAAVLRT